MASAIFNGTGASSRVMRLSIPGPTFSQRSTSGQQDSVLAQRQRLTTPQRQICRASRREYRGFGDASDWSGLFQSLAEMSRAFEAASTEYRTGEGEFRQRRGGGGRRRAESEGEPPIDADAEEVERPMIVPVDVEESADGYNLYMDVPGLQKADVKIQVFPQQRTITISGERKRVEAGPDQSASGRTFRRRYERRIGKFSRTLRLAKDLDVKSVSARVEKGVLCVSAAKVPAVDPAADSLDISIE